jgi:carboxymethylenebutenolidase
MTEDFVAAARWLKARPDGNGKIGAVGFCLEGDGKPARGPTRIGLNAAVPYYGAQPQPADVAKSRLRLWPNTPASTNA